MILAGEFGVPFRAGFNVRRGPFDVTAVDWLPLTVLGIFSKPLRSLRG